MKKLVLLGLLVAAAAGGLAWDADHSQASDSVPPANQDRLPAVQPLCPIVPDLDFPGAGCDSHPSEGAHTLVITNVGQLNCGPLTGPTLITRTAVIPNAPDFIDTEIIQMELTGQCGPFPITLRESPSLPSPGTITEPPANNTPGTLEFPADSLFDVFFEIDGTPLGTLHNNTPAIMYCLITAVPPVEPNECTYELQNPPVPIFNAAQQQVGVLTEAAHTLKRDVGGTTQLLVGGTPGTASGGGSGPTLPIAALAGGIGAAALLAVAAGGWYARRRWLC